MAAPEIPANPRPEDEQQLSALVQEKLEVGADTRECLRSFSVDLWYENWHKMLTSDSPEERLKCARSGVIGLAVCKFPQLGLRLRQDAEPGVREAFAREWLSVTQCQSDIVWMIENETDPVVLVAITKNNAILMLPEARVLDLYLRLNPDDRQDLMSDWRLLLRFPAIGKRLLNASELAGRIPAAIASLHLS